MQTDKMNGMNEHELDDSLPSVDASQRITSIFSEGSTDKGQDELALAVHSSLQSDFFR